MATQETKEILEALFSDSTGENYPYTDKFGQAMNIALESMVEVEQYRALGTVEELKEAREKQIPKKPIRKHENSIRDSYKCPTCGTEWLFGRPPKYCNTCGQKLGEEGGTSE